MMAAMAGTGVVSEMVILFDVLNVCRCMSSSKRQERREEGPGLCCGRGQLTPGE
jgi:hypothetical protein